MSNEIQALRRLNAELEESLRQHKEVLEEAMGAPIMLGTVIRAVPGATPMCLVATGGGTALVQYRGKGTVSPGDTVTTRGGMAFDKFDHAPLIGPVMLALDVRDDMVEIDAGGGRRLIYRGNRPVKKDDRIVVDAAGMLVIDNLGQATSSFVANESTALTWDDIGGQDVAKKALIEAIEMPYAHADLYAKYGKRPTKGVLMYGPPGCGKTLLAKAAATSLAKTHGKQTSTGFIYVKGPEILNKWVGESEALIRSLFTRARAHKAQHGYPALIFIDEADAILGRRGDDRAGNTLSATIVPMFLAEMDGFEDSCATVILATNRPDTLDPAVVRDGRVDAKVYVGRPNLTTTPEIFKLHLRGKALASDIDPDALATRGAELLFDATRVLYRVATTTKGTLSFTLGHVVNGAMIAGVVDKAVSRAFHRDVQSKSVTASGVSPDDFSAAVDEVVRENAHLNHESELTDFTAGFKDQVKEITRATA